MTERRRTEGRHETLDVFDASGLGKFQMQVLITYACDGEVDPPEELLSTIDGPDALFDWVEVYASRGPDSEGRTGPEFGSLLRQVTQLWERGVRWHA